MADFDLTEFKAAVAQWNIEDRKGTSVNMNRNDVCAILSLHYTHMVPSSALALAFGLSQFSMGRILRGRTHAAAYAEFENADKDEWDKRYLRAHHVQRVLEARAGRPAPKKPQPPHLAAYRPATRFDGAWSAYLKTFHVLRRDAFWIVSESAIDDGTSQNEFETAEEAFELGLSTMREYVVDYFQAPGYAPTAFADKFNEQPDAPRAEWNPANWRRLSK